MADAPVSSGEPLQPGGAERPGEVSGTISVVLADDQALMRMGFRMVLEAEEDITVVGEASDGTSALAQAKALHPDVILMDVRMPGMNGIEATERIAQECPSTRVLILTTFDLDEYAFAGLRAGASGFLLKDTDPQSLVDAVRTVHEGQSLLSPQVLARLVARMPSTTSTGTSRSTWAGEVEALTPRQREVLLLIARGLSNSEIEVELGITRATCRSHITALLARLGARDRAQLVIAAYEAGLISPR